MTCLRSLPVRNWWTLRVKVPTDPRAVPQVALPQRLADSAVSSIVRPMVSCLANCLVRCMALALLMAFGIGCPLAAPHLAQAEEWQASLYNEGLPTHLVAVDKKRQTFMFLALPGFPWVADLLMSFPEGTNEGYGPIFSDSRADRALVC